MNTQKMLGIMLVLSLLGCSHDDVQVTESHPPAVAASAMPQAASSSGPAVARALEARYADRRMNCGKDSMPAFLCSGIILRGTRPSTEYDAWNPSPTAVRVGGVSFSYLRSDYNFRRLAFTYNNGFILTPFLSAAPEKYHMQVLCFFPVDGASDNRSDFGCGPNTVYPVESQPCDRQGITTGEQYRDHFNRRPDSYEWRCGFNVQDSANNAAGPAFYQGMRGGRMVAPYSFEIPNDLKHAVWPQNIPAQLPIEAFFYTQSGGRAGAQYDQKRFYELTRIPLPVISVQLPTVVTGTATFQYLPADQAITVP
ncbi:MAG: halovibrin HvnA [Pseudomonas sp.]|uniref:halovibrin HvnA n=1 Tax=Pseudomonas sp. TaxID=306 RepID=UPI003D6F4625